MSLTLKTSPTITGGTAVVLTNSGASTNGSTSFFWPTNTRLLPRVTKFFTNVPTTTPTNPGTVRAGCRLILGNRVDEEGCCTVKSGSVIINLQIDWPLDQPTTLVDEAITDLAAIVNEPNLLGNLVKLGLLPA